DAYPGEMFSGSIVSMGTIVQTTEGRFRKVTALVQNESGKIIPGMFAKVKVILIHEEDVITIPNSAFLDIQKDTSSIWVVEEEKSLKREVSVKHFNNDSALIETGLKVGDQVVIDVAMVKLEEGKPVEIVEVKEASASGK
ncbi:MAG: hypothetical protein JW774_09735, partial [Candidatus Aureabacteria bacterium]|nr:hypothetical protein [Candidatus Auribacterota bacterium]